jgi:hypothetical protein
LKDEGIYKGQLEYSSSNDKISASEPNRSRAKRNRIETVEKGAIKEPRIFNTTGDNTKVQKWYNPGTIEDNAKEYTYLLCTSNK